ncbi:MAG TPA: GntR family transcriptional regulator [Chloroflexota bacterium]|nr:GntR family transcriptional regulator [Chloroflexota bacterium]
MAMVSADETPMPPSHKTLRDWVFECLRTSIVSGDLAPGQRIVEADLAKQLDVSKSPVREAILQLKQDGLVIDAPKGRGVVVAPLKPNDVREICAVREALEGLAARVLAADPQPERLAPLAAILDRMREAHAAGDVRRQFELDVEFHTALCAATGNRRLQDLFSSIRPDLQRIFLFAVNAMALDGAAAAANAIADHAALLEAISAGDAQRAVALLAAHIGGQSDQIAAALGGS